MPSQDGRDALEVADIAVTDAATLTADEARSAAAAILPWMVEIRRDLHRHPELSEHERRTGERVRVLLDELEIEHRTVADTGVLGLIEGGRPGPAVALRADLDALPIEEASEVPYRSRTPGTMHACGHDVHTAVLLGAARILAERRARLGGTVKLLFQPAEETVGGAERMIAAGVMTAPEVAAVFGLHVESSLPVGQVAVRYGQRNAASDAIVLTVRGLAAHAAYPSGGIDAIVAAAHVVSALQTVTSRNVDARDSAVITFGTVAGGTQSNIVCDRVTLEGTVRTLSPRVRERVLKRLVETAEGVAGALGARAEVTIEPGYPALINDRSMTDVARRNARQLLGEDNVTVKPVANMGVEDFAYFLHHAPGTFYSLGVRNEARGIIHAEHTNRFDVDEDCLAVGAALQALNAVSVLQGSAE